MNFFRKLFAQTQPDEPIEPLEPEEPPEEIPIRRDNSRYGLQIVGESNYQDALREVCNGKQKTFLKAKLVLENNNSYDKNAVRVEIDGKRVGYLPRDVAPGYRDQLKKQGHPNATGITRAKIVSGSRGIYGVRLDIPVE